MRSRRVRGTGAAERRTKGGSDPPEKPGAGATEQQSAGARGAPRASASSAGLPGGSGVRRRASGSKRPRGPGATAERDAGPPPSWLRPLVITSPRPTRRHTRSAGRRAHRGFDARRAFHRRRNDNGRASRRSAPLGSPGDRSWAKPGREERAAGETGRAPCGRGACMKLPAVACMERSGMQERQDHAHRVARCPGGPAFRCRFMRATGRTSGAGCGPRSAIRPGARPPGPRLRPAAAQRISIATKAGVATGAVPTFSQHSGAQ